MMSKNLLLLCVLIIIHFLGLSYALLYSPVDVMHGEYVKIMYIHVPAAWLSILIYVIMGVCNLIFLFKRNNKYNVFARSLAPVGICFSTICIVTGSIWGKPMWNCWWVWDARLTTMLIMLFLYLGYISVWDQDYRFAQTAALLNIIGLINIPIIKYSVNLWASLHQPESINLVSMTSSIHVSMLKPLLIMFTSSTLLSTWIFFHNVKKITSELNAF